MLYPKLDIKWTYPLDHERKIFSGLVYELNYFRFALLGLLLIITGFFLIWVDLILLFTGIAVALITIVILLFPKFIKPWDVVLSNKRLTLRSRFWNIANFSEVVNFNLAHLDTQTITPRIKIIPLTLGFAIFTSIFLPLIDFTFSGETPLPVILRFVIIILTLTRISPVDINQQVEGAIDLLISPLSNSFSLSLLVSFLSLTAALIFFSLGLPIRNKIVLSSIGRHSLTINAGFPNKVTDYLYSIARKQRQKDDPNWKWDIPLLEDEEIKEEGTVGLIDRNQIILGVLSIIVLLDSIISAFNIFQTDFSIGALILPIIYGLTLFFIGLSIYFSKRWLRIVATNSRIIFQEERRTVSGLYGKRIYQYSDIPFKNVQGFTYSKFTGFSSITYFVALLIIIIGLGLASVLTEYTLLIQIGTGVITALFIIFEYKTYTSLSIISVSGRPVKLSYTLTFFLEKLAHKVENRPKLYARLFPNILSEDELIAIMNQIRGVKNPIKTLDESEHQIAFDVFVDKSSKELGKWQKLAPYRWIKQSISVGFLLGVVAIVIITISFWEAKIPFILIALFISFSGLALVITTIRGLVFLRNNLILFEDRLFRTQEINPRKTAILFGVLPYRAITEIYIKFVNSVRYRFSSIGSVKISTATTTIMAIAVVLFIYTDFIISLNFGFSFLFLYYLIVVGYIPVWVRELAKLVPRYSFIIKSRFSRIEFPFLSDIKEFTSKFKEAYDK